MLTFLHMRTQGVFVVERPGLPEFLHQLAGFAEVIIYTAGGLLSHTSQAAVPTIITLSYAFVSGFAQVLKINMPALLCRS
jgi:hypothetical protein